MHALVGSSKSVNKETLLSHLKSKAIYDNVSGIKHRDIVEYTYKNGETHRGYVTGLVPNRNAINFKSPVRHCKTVNVNKVKLLWKFTNIYWL